MSIFRNRILPEPKLAFRRVSSFLLAQQKTDTLIYVSGQRLATSAR
jgi:hypothetical protein